MIQGGTEELPADEEVDREGQSLSDGHSPTPSGRKAYSVLTQCQFRAVEILPLVVALEDVVFVYGRLGGFCSTLYIPCLLMCPRTRTHARAYTHTHTYIHCGEIYACKKTL